MSSWLVIQSTRGIKGKWFLYSNTTYQCTSSLIIIEEKFISLLITSDLGSHRSMAIGPVKCRKVCQLATVYRHRIRRRAGELAVCSASWLSYAKTQCLLRSTTLPVAIANYVEVSPGLGDPELARCRHPNRTATQNGAPITCQTHRLRRLSISHPDHFACIIIRISHFPIPNPDSIPLRSLPSIIRRVCESRVLVLGAAS